MGNFSEWPDAPAADYAVLGDPIGHSLSPVMHIAAYRALGVDLTYVAIRVPATEFSAAIGHLRSLGYRGANLTVPLKELYASIGVVPSEDAAQQGAVNTLRFLDDRIEGINTDAPGLIQCVGDLGLAPGARILVLGAGGSSRTALWALSRAGFLMSAWNRTPAKLESIRQELGAPFDIRPDIDLDGIDLVLNATSASLSGQVPPVKWQTASPALAAMDLAYASGPTPFIDQAQQRGLRCLDGRSLLAAQGALSLEWWLGRPAPVADMVKAIR